MFRLAYFLYDWNILKVGVIMSSLLKFFASILIVTLTNGVAAAATLGLPTFTTAPSTISIVNEFGGNLPTGSYTLSLNSIIATADGAPELVGQAIDFSWFYNGGFTGGFGSPSLQIGGVNLLRDPLSSLDQLLIGPPIASDVFDPVSNLSTFEYSGIFTGFGPRISTFPEIVLQFVLNAPIPTLDGYLYCNTSNTNCSFSNTPGLSQINGEAVMVSQSFLGYPEGRITNATMTFSTVDGRTISPVPLPATGLLMLAALSLFAVTFRKKRMLWS
jgi:hypothetical protein